MTLGGRRSFGAQLEALREAAGYTQEELATIAGLSVHAVSALERGERRRPPVETVRALSAALDLTGAIRDAFVGSTRACKDTAAVDELSGVSQPQALTAILGRDAEVQTPPCFDCWSPAVPRSMCGGSGSTPSDRSRWRWSLPLASTGRTRSTISPPNASTCSAGRSVCMIPRPLSETATRS